MDLIQINFTCKHHRFLSGKVMDLIQISFTCKHHIRFLPGEVVDFLHSNDFGFIFKGYVFLPGKVWILGLPDKVMDCTQ